MNIRLLILIVFYAFFYLSFVQTHPCLGQHLQKDSSSFMVKNEEPSPPSKEDLRKDSPTAIEEYEREKLASRKKNIGRRLLTVKTINPAEFYESPDDLERKLRIKREKEGFVIVKVVQNQLGTMNFYQVKFDTGQIGYLSADGNYLEIKIKEGSFISVPKRVRVKRQSVLQSKALASQAVELVKNDLTPAGSVEKRMMDEKAKSFPYPRWKYEAKEIGGKKFRVLQYVEERSAPPFVRTWIVDLSTRKIKPENLPAKELYR
jgi:hypothetical protein